MHCLYYLTLITDKMTSQWHSHTSISWHYFKFCNTRLSSLILWNYMWPDLPKGVFIHAQFQDTLFIAICYLHQCTNSIIFVYHCWKLNNLLSLRPFSQAYLASMSARVTFKWPHLPLPSRQPFVNHYSTGWWVWPWI